jgi:hypothetical protein
MAKDADILTDLAADIAAAGRLEADAEIARLRSEVASLRASYKAALQSIDRERERADAIAGLSGLSAKPAKPGRLPKAGKGEATVIVALSDWHVEERVDPTTVNGLNDYDLDVAERRIAELAERFAVLLEHQRQLVKISRVIVWVGGDLISGHIHPDTAEMAQLSPLSAIRWAGERLRGFIDMVADMAGEVIVATNSGNHGRSTEKLRVGTELDHSFEQHLYLTMAGQEQRKNVRWQVGNGYLNMVDIEGFKIRFHHGHAVSYGGGVGGITIPTNKAIAAWDRIERADLTVFGHWHQFSWLRAGRYVSNGSLIGHSAYATRIKASYEPPCQAFVVIDHKRREVTDAKPIFCDADLAARVVQPC